jgi:hypothetical protein
MNLPIVAKLLTSSTPSIVYRTRVELLGEAPESPALQPLREQIRISPLATGLLSGRAADGAIHNTHAYGKWQGPHWTLACLAETGYPPGDRSLLPLWEQVWAWLDSERHFKFPSTLVIPGQEERVRRCASQEGNAVWYMLKLGLADGRVEELVRRLRQWQWPDGGWNCDKRPQASMSSLIETIIPIRALALHGKLCGDEESLAAARRAAEVLLDRHLFRHRRDGQIIHPAFMILTAPPFVHYSYFFALQVLAEAGLLPDERAHEALDLLEARRLPDGGWPVERRLYKLSPAITTRGSYVSWGPAGLHRSNEWATLAALYILKSAEKVGDFRSLKDFGSLN